jgi:uncharacterized Zn-binding protein involved in type VI secretion
MNHSINTPRLFALHAVSAVALTLVAAGASAQDTTTTSVRQGEPSYEAAVKNAEIVYVEGNDMVLKLESGKIEHIIVPSSEKFKIDGKEVTVSGLRPGTRLTQTITTTSTPHYVTTVRNLKGKVWHVNAPGSVIVTLPDHTNVLYKVPSHAKFTINGKPMTVFELKKGMKIDATIVTEEPKSVVEMSKVNVGQAPAPQLPPLLGVLLIQEVERPAQEVASNVAAEHAETLPETASNLPLIGLLGLIGLGSSLGLATARKLALARFNA